MDSLVNKRHPRIFDLVHHQAHLVCIQAHPLLLGSEKVGHDLSKDIDETNPFNEESFLMNHINFFENFNQSQFYVK